MSPYRDDAEIVAELRAMRPAPRPGFAAELDARAAAGFPREAGSAASWAGGLLDRLRSTPPRRVLAPAGALATAAIVVATAVVVTESNGPSSTSTTISAPTQATSDSGGRLAEPAGEAAAGEATAKATAPSTSSGTTLGGTTYSAPVPPADVDASDARDRAIERSAEIVIGTEPGELRADSARVFDAVHAADGIVLRSSIRDGEAGVADFELLIPSAGLGDALADLSAIGEVRSRQESTRDITAPTIGVGERLQDARARIDGLLSQLAEADTDAERDRVEAELREERHRVAALKSRLSDLERRANFSRVSLRIETGAAAAGPEEGGAWGLSDGLDDAGRVLEVAAAVTLVGLAVLAPFALLALLAWLTRRAWLGRARARALEQP